MNSELRPEPDRYRRHHLGLMSITSASVLWGIAPIFFGYFVAFPIAEGLAHRALWAMVWLGVLIIPLNLSGRLLAILKSPKLCILLGVSGLLVGLNWAIFLYAIAVNQLIEASFGYFIYPLMAIFIGVLGLGEKLSARSWLAVGLAAVGVILKGSLIGQWPLIALAVGGSFALYAVLRRQIDVDPTEGMMVEMFVLALAGIVFLIMNMSVWAPDRHFFFDGSSYGIFMAVMSGVVTALPLLLFHLGNRNLAFSQAGFLFYINPSLQLLVGIFVFSEPFLLSEMAAFGLIWLGLIIHLLPSGRQANTLS